MFPALVVNIPEMDIVQNQVITAVIFTSSRRAQSLTVRAMGPRWSIVGSSAAAPV